MDRLRSRPSQPLGPQIHAVPDNEKAYDSAGRKLPWAYDSVSSARLDDGGQRSREPVEKGPFGKSRGSRRGSSRSRSKTAEPQRQEDVVRKEQVAAEERVFGSLRKVVREREVLGEVDGNAVAQQAPEAVAKVMMEEQEATEVLLWGFGEEMQWSAIDFYERASGGIILEDYDRTGTGQIRAYDPTHAFSRSTLMRSLSKAALRKKNRYAGGEHWIKVTFESREAAELACARSPHVVRGHLCYAEPWQGRGPARDEGVEATAQGGARVGSGVLPQSFSTAEGVVGGSPNGSGTISSATEREREGERNEDSRTLTQGTSAQLTPPGRSANAIGTSLTNTHPTQQLQHRPSTVSRTGTASRLRGAQLATLLPAEQALMPKQPKQSWSAWLGASELIGTTVPRREDGGLDWERASWYWRVWWWVDGVLGTDFCGMKGED